MAGGRLIRGGHKQVGIAIKLSDTPGTVRGLPPLEGEHTDEILTELGYSRKLRQKEAIG